ncbi:MAG: hypothetical protein ACRDD7_13715 [Peptostreptococcaceae bacterium]
MKSTNALVSRLFPIISTSLAKNNNKLKACIGRFIEKRSKELYDTCPCDVMFFGADDIEDFYKSLGITEKQINDVLRDTYYYSIASFNPRAAKDEFTVAMIMVIRYYYLKKMNKELELATIYLAFSGKFYPSVHHGSYPVCPPSEHRHVMEYVVNHRLSNKYDIKREGSIFGAIRSVCLTWLETYEDKLKDADDEDIVYLIQQLHDRIKSFMINIAREYYEVYNDKDAYMVYDSDNLSEDGYRLADNDSLKIERHVEKTMSYINNTGVDYKICKMASDSNVKTDEIKGIVELILSENNNIPLIKEFIRLMVTEYFVNSKNKDIRDIDFITFSITPKPNSKNVNILRQKEIIESFLSDNSPSYRKRRSREATKNSYHKSITTYFVLITHNANK